MRPIVKYFGSRWKLAKHYGRPTRDLVIEPFAGMAGFSLYWECPKVILIEKYKPVADIWSYLISHATEQEIRAVPDDAWNRSMVRGPEPLKDIVCYWFSRGDTKPRHRMTDINIRDRATGTGGGKYWSADIKRRLIDALPLVRGWGIAQGNYDAINVDDAYYFIDPPFQHAGQSYGAPSSDIDYAKLGAWCRAKKHGVVCETTDADWLPFVPLKDVRNQNSGRTSEAIYRLGT